LFLESVSLVSTTQDRVLLDAIAFLLTHKRLHSKWLPISHAPLREDDLDSRSPLLDLSFVTDKWRPLVTGNKDRGTSVSCVDRRYLELCVFSNVMLELGSALSRQGGYAHILKGYFYTNLVGTLLSYFSGISPFFSGDLRGLAV
jgi:hypothetical protein